LLLATQNDAYPRPNDSLGSLAGHLSGPAPGRRVPCGVCLRSGYTAGRKLCLVCGGLGWRKRRKGEDPFDEYTGEPVADAASKSAHAPAFRLEDDYRRLGAQLDRVQRTLAAREGRPDASYGWERAREAQERLGSYRELRAALRGLQRVSPNGYSVIRAAWLTDLPVTLVGRTQAIERAAVLWLQAEMPGEVRVPPWLMTDVYRERRTVFEQLVAAGRSASEIARVLDLPKRRVKKMLKTATPIRNRPMRLLA
jgi:hypothetical protein